MRVLPLDCITILGIRFGGRVPPSDLILGSEALAILGLTDPTTCYGLTNVYLRVRYLKEVLEGELQKPPTDL
jgi:hypothetical protein